MDMVLRYFPLCWLSASPLDLPRSYPFFKINLAIYFLLEFFIQFNMSDDIETILEVIYATLFTVLFVCVVLTINRSSHACLQVLSAILFCENVVSVVFVPIVVWVTVTEEPASYALLALFLFWDTTLIANIFRHALHINAAASMVVSVVFFISTYGAAYGLHSLLSG